MYLQWPLQLDKASQLLARSMAAWESASSGLHSTACFLVKRTWSTPFPHKHFATAPCQTTIKGWEVNTRTQGIPPSVTVLAYSISCTKFWTPAPLASLIQSHNLASSACTINSCVLSQPKNTVQQDILFLIFITGTQFTHVCMRPPRVA